MNGPPLNRKNRLFQFVASARYGFFYEKPEEPGGSIRVGERITRQDLVEFGEDVLRVNDASHDRTALL